MATTHSFVHKLTNGIILAEQMLQQEAQLAAQRDSERVDDAEEHNDNILERQNDDPTPTTSAAPNRTASSGCRTSSTSRPTTTEDNRSKAETPAAGGSRSTDRRDKHRSAERSHGASGDHGYRRPDPRPLRACRSPPRERSPPRGRSTSRGRSRERSRTPRPERPPPQDRPVPLEQMPLPTADPRFAFQAGQIAALQQVSTNMLSLARDEGRTADSLRENMRAIRSTSPHSHLSTRRRGGSSEETDRRALMIKSLLIIATHLTMGAQSAQ